MNKPSPLCDPHFQPILLTPWAALKPLTCPFTGFLGQGLVCPDLREGHQEVALWTCLPSAQGGVENLSRQLFFKFIYFLATCWENEKLKQNIKTRGRDMRVYSRKADLKSVLRKPSTFYRLIFQKIPKGLQNPEQFFSLKCLHFFPITLLPYTQVRVCITSAPLGSERSMYLAWKLSWFGLSHTHLNPSIPGWWGWVSSQGRVLPPKKRQEMTGND